MLRVPAVESSRRRRDTDLTRAEGAGSAAGSTATDKIMGGTEEGRRMSAWAQ